MGQQNLAVRIIDQDSVWRSRAAEFPEGSPFRIGKKWKWDPHLFPPNSNLFVSISLPYGYHFQVGRQIRILLDVFEELIHRGRGLKTYRAKSAEYFDQDQFCGYLRQNKGVFLGNSQVFPLRCYFGDVKAEFLECFASGDWSPKGGIGGESP